MWRALSCTVLAALVVGPASAQIRVTPITIQLDALTCRQLLELDGDRRDRLLIYLNGYFDGGRKTVVWDERQAAERIDRALAECKGSPEKSVLRVFANAWAR
jgi:hypothetical protein